METIVGTPGTQANETLACWSTSVGNHLCKRWALLLVVCSSKVGLISVGKT